LVRESFEALRILADANRYSRLRGAARAAAESDGRLRERKHASGGGSGKLVVVGGEDDGDSHLKTAEWYDASAGQWRALPDMSVERCACAAVCIEGNVYVVGGWHRDSDLKSAEVYDTMARQWRAFPEMSVERSSCAAVSIDGNVYVVGGFDGRSSLKSAEMYDTSAGQWRALPEMSVARLGCAAVCIDGNVYVVGGHDGDSDLKSAEMYDTSAGQWRALPEMSVARIGRWDPRTSPAHGTGADCNWRWEGGPSLLSQSSLFQWDSGRSVRFQIGNGDVRRLPARKRRFCDRGGVPRRRIRIMRPHVLLRGGESDQIGAVGRSVRPPGGVWLLPNAAE
jgi:hypothetical protein